MKRSSWIAVFEIPLSELYVRASAEEAVELPAIKELEGYIDDIRTEGIEEIVSVNAILKDDAIIYTVITK